ncbi:hypothetical protein RRG08_049703 [Elysia crispata]|uniref:Uncharacterized protein n=1 Tax=Elysia crispata TaxID=231223 RepID=A0AAE1DYT7_9GAST|nr:hypothetical protein RRG08_049703 [Elysia crispata]
MATNSAESYEQGHFDLPLKVLYVKFLKLCLEASVTCFENQPAENGIYNIIG